MSETSNWHASEGAAPRLQVGSDAGDRHIGPYRLLQRIGVGGMGEVWLAEQTAPVRRRVAVKLVKLGMDTRQVVARFEAERQALAMMNHPNIAAVLDGGATESGRPYFVMEYVPGEPITTYCDKHRLTIRGRLELFIQVCQAVQHAHQKAVIHRDIKPSNILVCLRDNQPAPKVIDFGVAKATHHRLTEQTLYTELGQIIGTPEYMSPEQAEPVPTDVDTRTDVYSLGVLLYELLTGTLPFDPKALRSRGYAEIQRIIREVDPPKPSTRLQHTLWGGSGVRRERPAPADLLGAANHPPGEDLSTAPQKADSTLARSPSPHADSIPRPAPATRHTAIAFQRHTDPKTLWRTIRGDLDWIVMKCLEKEPSWRYGSPEEISADLRRYLKVEPVQARPPSISYRFARGVRRHRFAATLGLTVTAALVATTLLSINAALRESRLRAEVERAHGEGIRHRLIAEASLMRQQEARRLAEEAQQRESALREQAEAYALRLEREAAEPYIRELHVRADVLMDLGQFAEARRLLFEAMDIASRQYRDNGLKQEELLYAVASSYWRESDLANTELCDEQLVAARRRNLSSDWSISFWSWDGYRIEEPSHWKQVTAGSPLATLRSSELACIWGSGEPAPGVPRDRFATVAETTLHCRAGRYAILCRADDAVRLSVDGEWLINEFVWHPDAVVARLEMDWSDGEHKIRIEHAEYAGGAQLYVVIRGEEDQNRCRLDAPRPYTSDVAYTLAQLATVRLELGDPDGAVSAMQETAEIHAAVGGVSWELVHALNRLGYMENAAHCAQEAAMTFETSIRYTDVLDPDGNIDAAVARIGLALALHRREDSGRASALIQQAYAELHQFGGHPLDFIDCFLVWSEILSGSGSPDAAEGLLHDALALLDPDMAAGQRLLESASSMLEGLDASRLNIAADD